MEIIKDKNGRDLTEAEDIKKRWQEYTEELYQKDLDVPGNTDSVAADLDSWRVGHILMTEQQQNRKLTIEPVMPASIHENCNIKTTNV